MQTNASCVLSRNWLLGRSNQQCRPLRIGRLRALICPFKFTGKSMLRASITVLDGQQTHIQFRVPVASKAERSDNLNQPHHSLTADVISHRGATSNQHSIPGDWNLSRLPRGLIRPAAIEIGRAHV